MQLEPDTTRPVLKKSRAGCKECRRRKVKCDESRPVCGNCSKRFIGFNACEYSQDAPPRPPRRTARPPRSKARPSCLEVAKAGTSCGPRPTSLPTEDHGRLRSLELRLMYHWVTVVSQLMPQCAGQDRRALWEITVPQLAFESDILMSPLLALSALHLHAHTPDDHLLSLSLSKYVDRSLVNQRTWIAQCGGGGAPRLPMQLFLAAIMLIYMSWLLTNRSQPGEEYRVPMQVFQMAEGARIIFQRKSGYFRDLGFDRWDLPPPTQDPTPLSPESLRWLCEMEDDIQHLLDGFCVESLPDKERRAYIQAAEYLRYVYRNSFGDIDHTRSLLSPIMGRMGIDFLQLLEACEPPALALFARAFVLLGSLEESWWLNGKGPYEVVGRNIKGILGLMPAKDRWSMDLPIRAISGVVKLTRPGEGQVSPGVYSPQAQMQSSRTLSLSPGSSTEGGQEWG